MVFWDVSIKYLKIGRTHLLQLQPNKTFIQMKWLLLLYRLLTYADLIKRHEFTNCHCVNKIWYAWHVFQNHLFKSGVLVVYYAQINIVWFPHLLSLFGREKRKKGSRQKIDINAEMEVWYCLNWFINLFWCTYDQYYSSRFTSSI